MLPLDIIGRRFGRLTVVEYVGKQPYRNRFKYFYKCRCDCGAEIVQVRSNLITSHTASCGCLKRRAGSASTCWSGCGEISGRMWSAIKAKAAERKLEFSVTIEQAWEKFSSQGGVCALTGVPLVMRSVKPNYHDRTASLDRIENERGYVRGNIQWVHKDINWMKGRVQLARFVELCRAVALHAERSAHAG